MTIVTKFLNPDAITGSEEYNDDCPLCEAQKKIKKWYDNPQKPDQWHDDKMANFSKFKKDHDHDNKTFHESYKEHWQKMYDWFARDNKKVKKKPAPKAKPTPKAKPLSSKQRRAIKPTTMYKPRPSDKPSKKKKKAEVTKIDHVESGELGEECPYCKYDNAHKEPCKDCGELHKPTPDSFGRWLHRFFTNRGTKEHENEVKMYTTHARGGEHKKQIHNLRHSLRTGKTGKKRDWGKGRPKKAIINKLYDSDGCIYCKTNEIFKKRKIPTEKMIEEFRQSHHRALNSNPEFQKMSKEQKNEQLAAVEHDVKVYEIHGRKPNDVHAMIDHVKRERKIDNANKTVIKREFESSHHKCIGCGELRPKEDYTNPVGQSKGLCNHCNTGFLGAEDLKDTGLFEEDELNEKGEPYTTSKALMAVSSPDDGETCNCQHGDHSNANGQQAGMYNQDLGRANWQGQGLPQPKQDKDSCQCDEKPAEADKVPNADARISDKDMKENKKKFLNHSDYEIVEVDGKTTKRKKKKIKKGSHKDVDTLLSMMSREVRENYLRNLQSINNPPKDQTSYQRHRGIADKKPPKPKKRRGGHGGVTRKLQEENFRDYLLGDLERKEDKMRKEGLKGDVGHDTNMEEKLARLGRGGKGTGTAAKRTRRRQERLARQDKTKRIMYISDLDDEGKPRALGRNDALSHGQKVGHKRRKQIKERKIREGMEALDKKIKALANIIKRNKKYKPELFIGDLDEEGKVTDETRQDNIRRAKRRRRKLPPRTVNEHEGKQAKWRVRLGMESLDKKIKALEDIMKKKKKGRKRGAGKKWMKGLTWTKPSAPKPVVEAGQAGGTAITEPVKPKKQVVEEGRAKIETADDKASRLNRQAMERIINPYKKRKKIPPKPALNTKTPAERKETLTAQNRDTATGKNIPQKPKKKKKKKDEATKADDTFPVFDDSKKKKKKKRTGESAGEKEKRKLMANLSPAVLANMKRIEALNQAKIDTEKDKNQVVAGKGRGKQIQEKMRKEIANKPVKEVPKKKKPKPKKSKFDFFNRGSAGKTFDWDAFWKKHGLKKPEKKEKGKGYDHNTIENDNRLRAHWKKMHEKHGMKMSDNFDFRTGTQQIGRHKGVPFDDLVASNNRRRAFNDYLRKHPHKRGETINYPPEGYKGLPTHQQGEFSEDTKDANKAEENQFGAWGQRGLGDGSGTGAIQGSGDTHLISPIKQKELDKIMAGARYMPRSVPRKKK